MNDTASPPVAAIRAIPLSQLSLAPENVRKTPPDEAAHAELIASILAHGLLENLVVRADGTDDDGRERLRRRRRRPPPRGAEGARRGRRARRRSPRALPPRQRRRRRDLAGRERRAGGHAPRRPGGRVLGAGRGRPHRRRDRRPVRGLRAPRRAADPSRRRRPGTPRRLPRRGDGSRNAHGVRGHDGPGAPARRLGAGLRPELPADALVGQAPAHRGARAGLRRAGAIRRRGGLRGRRRSGDARSLRRRARERRLAGGPCASQRVGHEEADRGGGRTLNPLEVGRGDGGGRLGHARTLRADPSRARPAHRRGDRGGREAARSPGRAPRA